MVAPGDMHADVRIDSFAYIEMCLDVHVRAHMHTVVWLCALCCVALRCKCALRACVACARRGRTIVACVRAGMCACVCACVHHRVDTCTDMWAYTWTGV